MLRRIHSAIIVAVAVSLSSCNREAARPADAAPPAAAAPPAQLVRPLTARILVPGLLAIDRFVSHPPTRDAASNTFRVSARSA